jgi:hypothetical protein
MLKVKIEKKYVLNKRKKNQANLDESSKFGLIS